MINGFADKEYERQRHRKKKKKTNVSEIEMIYHTD